MDIFLRISRLDERAIGTDGATGMEIIVVRNDNLAVGRHLEVEFKGNVIWQYRNVPLNVWLELESAPSKGKYFNTQIRDRFASTGYRVN